MVCPNAQAGVYQAVSDGSPFASEKGIHWRGTPARAHDGGRQQGPCSTGLFHSPCESLGTLERGP